MPGTKNKAKVPNVGSGSEVFEAIQVCFNNACMSMDSVALTNQKKIAKKLTEAGDRLSNQAKAAFYSSWVRERISYEKEEKIPDIIDIYLSYLAGIGLSKNQAVSIWDRRCQNSDHSKASSELAQDYLEKRVKAVRDAIIGHFKKSSAESMLTQTGQKDLGALPAQSTGVEKAKPKEHKERALSNVIPVLKKRDTKPASSALKQPEQKASGALPARSTGVKRAEPKELRERSNLVPALKKRDTKLASSTKKPPDQKAFDALLARPTSVKKEEPKKQRERGSPKAIHVLKKRDTKQAKDSLKATRRVSSDPNQILLAKVLKASNVVKDPSDDDTTRQNRDGSLKRRVGQASIDEG